MDHLPPSVPGPLVHGQETSVHALSRKQLEQSPFLPSLLDTINEAYARNVLEHEGQDERPPRLHAIDDFFANIREDLFAFTIIISSRGSERVLATATARRYHGRKAGNPSPWERTVDVEAGVEEWELKLMATHPSAQGCGLASYMMWFVEREIVERARARAESGEMKKLKMVLCTPLEVTGPFYMKKGYREDYRVWRGDGYQFHIVFLSKEIVVEG